MWTTGQADDYLALLQDLVELATNSHVTTVAVAAGGSGYTVGDLLRINGGTTVGGHTAAVEVLTTSGGAVATVRIARGGAYTANPGTGASTTAETGSGTGCTITTTIAATGWSVERRTQEAVSATIAAGGTGYANGNTLTVVLGSGAQGRYGAHATFTVSSTTGGAVTAVALASAGNYEEPPSNDAQVTGGAGTGCQLTVTWQDATTQEQVLVLSGTAAGFEDPIAAIETYQDLDQFVGTQPVRNWMLFGLVAWNPALPLHQQLHISPGHDATLSGGHLTQTNPTVTLKGTSTGFPIRFWFSITGRRIIGFFEVTDATPVFHYPQMYLGFHNQAGTAAELPYPMYVGASSWRAKAQYAETTPVIGGLSMASGAQDQNTLSTTPRQASHFFWDTTSERWWAVTNFTWNAAGTTLDSDTAATARTIGLYPLLGHETSSDSGPTSVFAGTAGISWFSDIIDRALPAAPTIQLHPTPGATGDLYLLIPLTLFAHAETTIGLDAVYGELDGCFYVSAAPSGSVSTLDTFLIGTERFRVFQNGNRTDFNRAYLAVREA